MMELFKKALDSKDSPKPGNQNGSRGGKQKKKCPHCGLEVYHKPEKCSELEANADKRPANWKRKKSSWRCTEDKSTEQWRPGKVDLSKIITRFPYLVATGFDPPRLTKHSTTNLQPLSSTPAQDQSQSYLANGHAAWNEENSLAISQATWSKCNNWSDTTGNVRFGSIQYFRKHKIRHGTHRVIWQGLCITANGSKLPASNTALLPIRALSKGAREAIVVPGMT